MSGNTESKKFQYLAAKACGEIWSFNFRSMLISSYGKNIPISTYSNWSQRQSTPAYLPLILVNTLKKRLSDVNLAYYLHTYGLDERAGVVDVEGTTYNANLEQLIKNFLEENIANLKGGSSIYFTNCLIKRNYVFNYKDTITKKKMIDGKSVKVEELRGEPIRATFPVNFYALSAESQEGWDEFKVSDKKDFLFVLATLKDELKQTILKSTQLHLPYVDPESEGDEYLVF